MQSCVCELWAVFAWYCLGVCVCMYTVQTLIRPMFSLSLFPCFLVVSRWHRLRSRLLVLGCVVAMCKHTLSQVLGLLLLLVQGLQSLLEFNWAARHSLALSMVSALSVLSSLQCPAANSELSRQLPLSQSQFPLPHLILAAAAALESESGGRLNVRFSRFFVYLCRCPFCQPVLSFWLCLLADKQWRRPLWPNALWWLASVVVELGWSSFFFSSVSLSFISALSAY